MTAVAMLAVVDSASAFTSPPVWKCRASALYSSVLGGNRVEPVVSNGNINTAQGRDPDHAQCVSAEAGAGNTATQLGIPQNSIGAQTASSVTTITPELGRAIDQSVSATGRVENLTIQIPAGGAIAIGVASANSTTIGTCADGKPVIKGDSGAVSLTLGGTPIPLDGLITAINQLLTPLHQVINIKVNEKITGADGSLTVRPLHITVLSDTGNGPPLLDVVAGETKIGFNGPVCDPDKQGVPGTGTGGKTVCPSGSALDVAKGLCIIPATSGSSLGAITVGRPFEGPSGGKVVPIDIARKKYKSPCLQGPGPKFVLVGTAGRDHLTGSNSADRILGLGGNDQIDGGRGSDCLDGGTGGDNLSGGLGNDRVYGQSGKDHLNGGPGSDLENAGADNDTINAAFGKDRAIGGSGNDAINIATGGPAASADCGAGNDTIRLNQKERKKVTNCETVYVFKDK